MEKFTQNDAKAYLAEVRRRMEERLQREETLRNTFNETSNDTLNDIKCFTNVNNIKCTLNDSSVKKSDFISKDKYIKMLQTLELWGVMKPKSLTFTYGVDVCYRMFEYVLNTPNVKNKGAYFRTILKRCA